MWAPFGPAIRRLTWSCSLPQNEQRRVCPRTNSRSAVSDVLADRPGVDVVDLGDLGRGHQVAADQLLLQRRDPAPSLPLGRVDLLERDLQSLVHGCLRLVRLS
jgi:hypothetical protein